MADIYSDNQESYEDRLVINNDLNKSSEGDRFDEESKNRKHSSTGSRWDYSRSSQEKLRIQTTKFLEKSDIINISVTYNLLDQEELHSLVFDLCTSHDINRAEYMKIMKRIINLEKLEIFEKLISAIINGALNPQNNIRSRTKGLTIKERYDNIVASQDDFDDHKKLISELFSYSIFAKKLTLSFYLFQRYRDYVTKDKSGCVDSIISIFQSQLNDRNFENVEVVLHILKRFLVEIDYERAFDLINVIEQLISK